MFVNSETSRLSNHSLFEIVEEQVFVVDESTKDILWRNKATDDKKDCLEDDTNISVSKANAALLHSFNFDEKAYALVDPKIFKNTKIDPDKTIQRINKLKNLKSLTEIIDENISNDYNVKTRKNTYKIDLNYLQNGS